MVVDSVLLGIVAKYLEQVQQLFLLVSSHHSRCLQDHVSCDIDGLGCGRSFGRDGQPLASELEVIECRRWSGSLGGRSAVCRRALPRDRLDRSKVGDFDGSVNTRGERGGLCQRDVDIRKRVWRAWREDRAARHHE